VGTSIYVAYEDALAAFLTLSDEGECVAGGPAAEQPEMALPGREGPPAAP
jgi:hypothetical protein